jgi:acetate kinase
MWIACVPLYVGYMMESRAVHRVTLIVLVLNCGSSSLKFKLIAIGRRATDRNRRLARGAIERIGGQATVAFDAEGRSTCRETAYVPDHPAGVRRVIDWLGASTSLPGGGSSLDVIGHRVVHGGELEGRRSPHGIIVPAIADTD